MMASTLTFDLSHGVGTSTALIRPVVEDDFSAIATLYRHYVDHTVATWAAPGEFATPSAFLERWKAGSSRGLPWIALVTQDTGCGVSFDIPESVFTSPGPHCPTYEKQEPLPQRAVIGPTRLIGYCYVGDFRPRAGWSITVEDSIYLAPGWEGLGLGRRLLTALLGACKELAQAGALRTIVAAISADPSDATVGAGSVALHKSAGFVEAGRLVGAGVKFGRRMDNAFLQLQL